MPLYDFECEVCGHEFEQRVPMDAPPPRCASCGCADVRRLPSLFGIGGGGARAAASGSSCGSCSAASCAGCGASSGAS